MLQNYITKVNMIILREVKITDVYYFKEINKDYIYGICHHKIHGYIILIKNHEFNNYTLLTGFKIPKEVIESII